MECDEINSNDIIFSDIILNKDCVYYVENISMSENIIFDGNGATISPLLGVNYSILSQRILIKGSPKVFKNVNFRTDVPGVYFALLIANENQTTEVWNINSSNNGRFALAGKEGMHNLCNLSVYHFNPENANLNFSKECFYKVKDHQVDLTTNYFCNGAVLESLNKANKSLVGMIEDPNASFYDCIFNDVRFITYPGHAIFNITKVLIQNSYFFNFSGYSLSFTRLPAIEIKTESSPYIINKTKDLVYIINNTFNATINEEIIRISSSHNHSTNFIYGNTFINGYVTDVCNNATTYWSYKGEENTFLNSTYYGKDSGTCEPGIFRKESFSAEKIELSPEQANDSSIEEEVDSFIPEEKNETPVISLTKEYEKKSSFIIFLKYILKKIFFLN